ncbi:alpha/beta fold hydrolase [Litorihabitans aurantiacus]|uniref:Esterase n=1 Tax=Litorihabitans aurantiacus TaxID=1930061 RepID=A0AA37UMI5_9MICO|nr:alpha/beta hydrolase [Litorihabitans aurantiacus]GMA31255.1 esterase [Litorihabitans aurantiacus]
MDVILIPGFWLDASSWDAVTPALVAAGHRVHPVTLPGAEAANDRRAEVTLRDQVAAVVALVDEVTAGDGGVVLVGHSGGAAVVHAAVDARPAAVVRAVYVDAMPLADGEVVNADLPVVDGVIPLPAWDVFDDDDLVDLTPELRDRFREVAVPVPAHVANDPQVLTDPRRYDVPVTVVACEFASADLQVMLDPAHPWHSYVREIPPMRDVTWVDLPTGHWPQLTRPVDLGRVLLEIVDGVTHPATPGA